MGTPTKGQSPPIFGHVYYGQTAVWIKMPLGTEVSLGLHDIVLDEDSTPLPSRGTAPQFSANVHCSQTAGWTKMPLCMEEGLGPGDFVFDGDPATTEKRAHPPHPIFGPCLLWTNSWMDENATWYGGKPRPGRRCNRWGRSSPLKTAQPLSFRFMSILAKQLDG